jgi:PPM family protein phosphatase
MDLFRRIFGKTNEEPPEAVNVDEELPDQPSIAEVTDEFDAATRPVGPQPASRPLNADGVTQPLDPEHLIAQRGDFIAFGQASDVGLVRNNNQDAVLSFYFTSQSSDSPPDFGLFVVADGMGGHHEGERASAITTRTIAQHLLSTICLPMMANQSSSEQPPITEVLVEAVQKANTEVIKQVPDGGTTVTAIAIVGDLAYVAHVGDSRAYYITKQDIEKITRDHSLVQRLIELHQLTPQEAAEHPQKNVLYRALGQSEALEVDTHTRRLPVNSRLLLCSDGLWSQVEERELFEIVMNSDDPQQACDKLVALANTRGGVDNITAILLKIS